MAYSGARAKGDSAPPPIARVIILILYSKRQRTNHDISEDGFEETFCVLTIPHTGYYGYGLYCYSNNDLL